jgi:lipopolysaccharide transport system ATP-binding protein
MSRAVAVSCRGVSKSFALVDRGSAWRLAFGAGRGVPHFKVLDDVTFDVPKGQFVGILGRNGAGKSTLLRVLGGVLAQDSGQITIDGTLSGLYELGLVGNPQLTGRQYAERLLTVHGFSRCERSEMIADIHEFAELGDRFEDPVLTYSAGMGARLYFATATAGRYDVYLIDEVLSVGDQHFQSKCWRRLRDRVSKGASGVLVTHDWAAIVKLSETAYVLEKGCIIYSGPAERAARRYLYGEQARTQFHPGVAQFTGVPKYPRELAAGKDFLLTAEVEVLTPASVGCVVAIERLQPGFGWETALMSRSIAVVGATPGSYLLEVSVPALPLEPGNYQLSLHLVMSDPRDSRRRLCLDGYGWLDGNGLALDVVVTKNSGLTLPTRWSVETA